MTWSLSLENTPINRFATSDNVVDNDTTVVIAIRGNACPLGMSRSRCASTWDPSACRRDLKILSELELVVYDENDLVANIDVMDQFIPA